MEIPDKKHRMNHIYAINLPFQTAENQLMNYARLVYLIWHFFQIRPYFYPTIDVSACTEVSRRIAFSVYGDDHIGVAFLKVFFTILCEARLKDKLAYLFKDFANSKYWIRHFKYALMLMGEKCKNYSTLFNMSLSGVLFLIALIVCTSRAMHEDLKLILYFFVLFAPI